MGSVVAIRTAHWKAVAFTTHTDLAPVGLFAISITDRRILGYYSLPMHGIAVTQTIRSTNTLAKYHHQSHDKSSTYE